MRYNKDKNLSLEGLNMSTIKQTAIDAITKMPDSVKIDEIMYKLYVIDKINKGEKDIQEGNFLETNQLRKEIEQE
jgi:hypothetical protein